MSTITSPKVKSVLNALYEDSARNRPSSPPTGAPPDRPLDPRAMFEQMPNIYMAIAPEFGHLLYSLVRSSGARHIVEFGTSMGVSTIYLAAGLQDIGVAGGKLITTEYLPSKIERARKNLTDAGLVSLVDFRAGDAMESLRVDMPDSIDFVFLDGAKTMYLDVLRLLEPRLKKGAIIAADNTDHDGLQNFLAHVRDSRNGYVSSAINTLRDGHPSGHEIAIRA